MISDCAGYTMIYWYNLTLNMFDGNWQLHECSCSCPCICIYLSISFSLSPSPSQRFNLLMYPMLVIIPLNFGRNLLRSLPISSQNAAGNASAVLVDSSSHSDRSNALLLRGEESTWVCPKLGSTPKLQFLERNERNERNDKAWNLGVSNSHINLRERSWTAKCLGTLDRPCSRL